MLKKKTLFIGAGIAAVVVGLLIVNMGLNGEVESKLSGPTFEVRRGPLTISFIESGTIKAGEQRIIKNEVEGRTSIIYLIDEGDEVKEGDLLVELDSSELEDLKIEQEIRVQNAEASYISAKENLAVVENQAQSDVALAKQTLEFAKQDLDKYIKGEFPFELDQADAEIQLAKEELTRARDVNDWSTKLYKEKYISETDYLADKLALKRKELNVELAKNSKELLVEYTKKRQIAQLNSDVTQSEMAMERTNRKAKADVIQADANLKAKEAEYQRQQAMLEKTESQLEKTRIYAPMDGIVIYATSARMGWRGNDEPLKEGQEVREREELIYLRTGDVFKAEINIHEANIKKTKLGLPAILNIDALPGKTFYGELSRVAPLPDAQSMWMNPDLKVYNSEIAVEGGANVLRTGMSCQAEIIVDKYPDAVYVPIQSVTRIANQPVVYAKQGNSFQPRQVRTGMDNNKMIHIVSGLKKGEQVLLAPPLKSSESSDEDGGTNALGEGAGDLQSRVDAALENSKSQSPADSKAPQESNENLKPSQLQEQLSGDPEKVKEMREKFEQMSAEEKQKLREQFEKMRQNNSGPASNRPGRGGQNRGTDGTR